MGFSRYFDSCPITRIAFFSCHLAHPCVSLAATSSPSACCRGALGFRGTPDLICSAMDANRGMKIKMEPIGRLRAHRGDIRPCRELNVVYLRPVGGGGWGALRCELVCNAACSGCGSPLAFPSPPKKQSFSPLIPALPAVFPRAAH